MSRSENQNVPLLGVARALRVLDLFLDAQTLGAREIARRLDISAAAAYRLVTTLVAGSYLEQDPDSKLYSLSPRVTQLARTVGSRPDVRRAALAYLRHLQELTNETVCLHAVREGYRVCILQLESPQELRMVVPVRPLPIFYGATDQILRVFGNPADFGDALDTSPEGWDDKAPRRPSKAELDEVQAKGWAVSYGSRIPGGTAVAAPVWSPGELLALSVFGPKERMIAQGIEKIAGDITSTATELSAAMLVLDQPEAERKSKSGT
ncbi:MAG: helix-turn-helix domain-containing protein [Gemmatimonas sp.]|nr:helix-turn-helix domain-containing protein [Gemmatimonas sp.]